MSIMNGGELGDFLIAQTQIEMRGALAKAGYGESADEKTTDSSSAVAANAKRDSLIATMSGLAGLDMSGFGELTASSTQSVDIASLIASVEYPNYFSSNGGTVESESASALESLITSGYESMLSNGIAALLDDPAQAILAQSNANALNVLKLFS